MLSPQFKTLSYQPAIRGDCQINANLRTAKYTGQKGFRGLTPGTIPGFNDTYNAYPWVHAFALRGRVGIAGIAGIARIVGIIGIVGIAGSVGFGQG